MRGRTEEEELQQGTKEPLLNPQQRAVYISHNEHLLVIRRI